MNEKIRELRQNRAGLIKQARDLVDAADNAKREMSEEEQRKYDAIMDDVGKMAIKIQAEEQLVEAERSLGNQPQPQAGRRDGKPVEIEFRSRGMKNVRSQNPRLTESGEWRDVMVRATPEYQAAYRRFLALGEKRNLLPAEERNLQADIDIAGGFLQAPLQMVDDLIAAVDDLVYMRQWATVYAVPSAQALGVPSIEHDIADAVWTNELGTGDEDATLDFGRRELHPHPLAKRIRVSRKLLRAVPDVEGLVNERMAYKHAIPQENGFLNGNGANQPLGVFTASPLGIPVAQDVNTDNVAAGPTMNGLTEAKYHLKTQYWPRCRWIFHRDIAKLIAKLKDGEGQYIWRESVRAGEPDRLLNIPVFLSEYAPNVIGAGAYVGIIGDFSKYWIADAMSYDIQRLDELYAATNQVGFIGRLETDGMPVLAEAFIRVTLP